MEAEGNLRAGGTWTPSGAFSPPPSIPSGSWGEEALGGCSRYDEGGASVEECEVATLSLLKVMPSPVTSLSESTATTAAGGLGESWARG